MKPHSPYNVDNSNIFAKILRREGWELKPNSPKVTFVIERLPK